LLENRLTLLFIFAIITLSEVATPTKPKTKLIFMEVSIMTTKELTAFLATRYTATETTATATPEVASTPTAATVPPKAKPIKQPAKITDITIAFVIDFMAKPTTTKAACMRINALMAFYKSKYEDRGGNWFPPFRMAFAKEFLPDLIEKRKAKKKAVDVLVIAYEIEQNKPA
jgi:hypothetical protein